MIQIEILGIQVGFIYTGDKRVNLVWSAEEAGEKEFAGAYDMVEQELEEVTEATKTLRCQTRKVTRKDCYCDLIVDKKLLQGQQASLAPYYSQCMSQDKNKRVLRHSAGIFVGVFPCGIVTCFEELFGAEGAGQVIFHLLFIETFLIICKSYH